MDPTPHPGPNPRPPIWPILAFAVAVVRTLIDVWQLFGD